MPPASRHALVVAVALAMIGSVTIAVASARGDTAPDQVTGASAAIDICPAPAPGYASCLSQAVVLPAVSNDASYVTTANNQIPYNATTLANIYDAASLAPAANTTVAIVDAFGYPNAASDLAQYRSQNGLPACTTAGGSAACLRIVNEYGGGVLPGPDPSGGDGWQQETALDLDAVSAICPGCRILLVQADSSSLSDLGKGVTTAAASPFDVRYISMSWGSYDDESAFATNADTALFDNPNVVYVAATGDKAWGHGLSYPATSPSVVAAGGVSVGYSGPSGGAPNGSYNIGGWGSTCTTDCVDSEGYAFPYDGAGSGCSKYEPRPPFQDSVSAVRSLCGDHRGASDVSALADPATGIEIYVNGGWFGTACQGGFCPYGVGGTSLATPILTALYALTGVAGTDDQGSLGQFEQQYAYSHASKFLDVLGGANGTCETALCNNVPGWDGISGVGTPTAAQSLYFVGTWSRSASLPVLSASPAVPVPKPPAPPAPAPSVSANNPGSVQSYTGVAANVDIHATASDGAAITYVPAGLPTGVTLDSAGGRLTGIPRTAGTRTVTVTVNTTSGANVTLSFVWTVLQNRYVPSAKPRIAGTTQRGRTVRVSATSWRTLAGTSVKPRASYQWLLNGRTIRGANKPFFTIPKRTSYRGKRLTLRVTIGATTYIATYRFTTAATRKIT
jgi:hypothetical protein